MTASGAGLLATQYRFRVGEKSHIGALLLRPPDATALYLFAHGAGAGMRHPFMEDAARDLAVRRIATLRYEFPYMAAGRRRPDSRRALVHTVRAAVREAAALASDLPLIAGGKSMGGRMTSIAAAEAPLGDVRGLVFHGFPLHRPGDPSDSRADHLASLSLPMLFVQGSRDRLAELDRIRLVCGRLGSTAALRVIEGADHGFSVLKRSGRSSDDVRAELADVVARWIQGVVSPASARSGRHSIV